MPQSKMKNEKTGELTVRQDAEHAGLLTAETLLLRDRQLTLHLSAFAERVTNPLRPVLAGGHTPEFLDIRNTPPSWDQFCSKHHSAPMGVGKTERMQALEQLDDATSLLYGLRVAAEESRQAAAEARDATVAALAAASKLHSEHETPTTLAHLAGRFAGNPLWEEMEEAAAQPWLDIDGD